MKLLLVAQPKSKKSMAKSLHGYISVIDHFSFFRSDHSCREFLDHDIIMRSHYNRRAEIFCDVK